MSDYDFAKHQSVCNVMIEELNSELSETDVEALKNDLGKLGGKEWVRWQNAREAEIVQFVEATYARRRKMKYWDDLQYRRRMVLAAIHHCTKAAALFRVLDEDGIAPGRSSYRDSVGTAGLTIENIYCQIEKIPYWNLWGESPFPEDRLTERGE